MSDVTANATFVGDYAVVTTTVIVDIDHDCKTLCECADDAIESEAISQLKSSGIDVDECGLGLETIEVLEV